MKKLTLNLILLLTLLFFAGCKNEDGENANRIKVSYPTSTTNWHSGEAGTRIEWSGAMGSSIDCDIYKGDTYLGSYVTGVNNSENTGICEYQNQTPLDDFESGSNYRVKIKDNEGNYGWSAYFTITDRNDNIEIEVNQESTLNWAPGQEDVGVTWVVDTAAQGDSVSLHVYHEDSYIDVFSDEHLFVPNTGSYIRTNPVPESWNTRGQYILRVKITSTTGSQDYGYTNSVMVQEKQPTIMVTMPTGTSVFLREEPAEIKWENASANVNIYLYEGLYGDPVLLGTSTLHPNGSMDVVFDDQWNNSLYYLVKIEDDNGEFGWSSYFPIGNIPTEGLLADYIIQNNVLEDQLSGAQGTISQNMTTNENDRFGNANSALSNNIMDDSHYAEYAVMSNAAALLDTLTVGEDDVTFAVWFKTDWRPEGEDLVTVIYSVCNDTIDTTLNNDVIHHVLGINEEGSLICADNRYIATARNEMTAAKWGTGYNDNEWHLAVINIEADGSRKGWISNNGETYDGFDYYYMVAEPLQWDNVNYVAVGLGQPFTEEISIGSGSYEYTNLHGSVSGIKIFHGKIDYFNAKMLYHINDYAE